MAKRHDLVLEAIDSTVGNSKATKPYRILEIGVYAGDNAVRMVKHAMNRGRPNVNYYGVDLFEDLTAAKSKEEMSKSKLPPSIKDVRDKVRKVTRGCWIEKGCSYEVIKDNAIRNIPQQDVIFIDGGHSLETIYQDWMSIQPLIHDKTVVVFDDFYHNRDDFGCARLVSFLLSDPVFNVTIADHIDKYASTDLEISCATVTRASNDLALPVPNQVRGLPEWSDMKLEGTPKEVAGVIDNVLSQGEDSGEQETPVAHHQSGATSIDSVQGHISEVQPVQSGGGSEGTDTTEQHSSPSPVLQPERGTEDRAVGERSEDVGRESTSAAAGDISQRESSTVRTDADAGDNDQASANPTGAAETGGAAGLDQ